MANADTVPTARIREAVARALEEDIGTGDLTGGLLGDIPARGRIVAEADINVAGLAVAAATFTQVDPQVEIHHPTEDGERVGPGDVLLEVIGPAAALLAAERVALNFLQRLSGVATLTAAFVAAVEGTQCRIADTRKTTPGLRVLEKYAVRVGGGANHRMGLYDGVLIKENHIAVAGGIAAAVAATRARVPHGLKIEVETTTLAEVDQALAAGAEIIMLDNFTVQAMVEAVARIDGRARVEASGGMTLERVAEVAATGVDIISVGRLTHSAPAAEMSMDMVCA